MKIGVRGHDYGRMDVRELPKLLKKEGYEAVQLAIPRSFNGIVSFDDITEDLLKDIKDGFDEAGIKIAVLSCYQDLSASDKAERRKAVDTFIRCLWFNRILKASVVGTETSYDHMTHFEKQEAFPLMMDSLYEITRAADTFNVDYAIEPVAWHPLEDAEITKEVIEKLNSDHVRVIFDLANVLPRPDETVQSAYWKRCFDLLGDRIEAIHLKDFIIDEEGKYAPRLLSKGCMDYSVLKEYLDGHPDMPVIREEMDPLSAAEDIRFMRKYFDES